MNADRLLAHYERIADAPDAVPRLRRFILDLAVRGKLVEQDPNDEPASELLERIAAEKARLLKVGEVRRRKPAFSIDQVGRRFAPPLGWSSTRLAFIVECLDYMREPINAAERKQRISGKSRSELFPYFGATQQQGWIDDYIFDEDLILLVEDGVPFFEPLRAKAYLIEGKSWVNNHAHVFRAILVSHVYLVHYLNTFDYIGRVVGATRSKLNQSRALDIPIMLPPLAEQHRIVAMVDELMALCDRLETARAEREATRDRLAAASLARLDAPDPDPATFRDHASFAVDNFTSLTTRRDQIKALRQTILNLAVRGKLVAQHQKDNCSNQGRLRVDALAETFDAQVFDERAALFNRPVNWKIEPLSRVASNIVDCLHTTPTWTNEGVLCIKTNQVRAGQLDLSSPYFVSEESYEIRVGRLEPKPDDVLYIREGGILGVACLVPPNARLCLGQRLMLIRTNDAVAPRFLELCLNSPWIAEFATEKTTGGAAPRVNMSTVCGYPIPLPPLSEQHRIVAKIDELMALCDRLEASLAAAADTHRRLLDALLYEALESTTDREAIA